MLSLIILICILYLSTASGNQLPTPPFAHVDKLIHALMYFTLGAAFFIDIRHKKWSTSTKMLATFTLCMLIGISIEVIQYFLPFRSFSLLDILANCFGCICVLFMYSIWHKWLSH